MSITASDVLYAKQSPQKLAKALGKDVTANEVFYMEQDPYKVAEKTGLTVSQVFYGGTGAGSSNFEKAVNPPAPVPEEKISVAPPSAEEDLFGKKVTDLVENLSFDENGAAKGTFKKITGYTEFSSIEGEQEGYYLPFDLTVPSTSTTVQQKSSRTGEWKTMQDPNLVGVTFLTNDVTTAKGITNEIKTNDGKTFTISISSEAIFEE